MSQFSGKKDTTGPKAGRKNKGVMAFRRDQKRRQAEERNARTTSERRSWKHGTGSIRAHRVQS